MTVNRLILSGTVRKIPLSKISPSGISHCKFLLEHCSVQIEAGFSRYAWCIVPVVVSYKNLENINNIRSGSKLTVHGFINSNKERNGLIKIVLHAEKIYFL